MVKFAKKWRNYNPISLLLCWMFDKQQPRLLWNWEWSAFLLFNAHSFFCPMKTEKW